MCLFISKSKPLKDEVFKTPLRLKQMTNQEFYRKYMNLNNLLLMFKELQEIQFLLKFLILTFFYKDLAIIFKYLILILLINFPI